VAKANLQLIVRAASRTICVSDAEHADLLDAIGSRAERRALVIHNGVTPLLPTSPEERAAVRAELGISPATLVGISVGALDEVKDPLTPVRAAMNVVQTGADIALIMIGDGPLRAQVEQVASNDQHPTVKVIGFRQDVQRFLGAADFFVLSSQREGLSFSLLEAMSLGLPAVVSDAPGNPEVVGDCGIVVPYGSVAGFSAAFERLVSDERVRLDLAARGRERIRLHFAASEMLSKTRQVYDAVVRTDP
jgi:glycosyltransferase involved in cell wall biosynthesis